VREEVVIERRMDRMGRKRAEKKKLKLMMLAARVSGRTAEGRSSRKLNACVEDAREC